ncbi:integrase-like protein [Humitalea rosea]|uniref:Integrase-like protein n=1 Tax=Humitalea rosea TaxID=990373 RepID=A0A2W7KBV7_9PROT|nr:integrase core domain-containing protein [Humitalea rosea]PZW45114.1 integrase-like protein [Humitalea rosea]
MITRSVSARAAARTSGLSPVPGVSRTRPYTPKTNGKAERFIQTSIREWACATPFQTSAERARAMHPWLHVYNTAKPHSALKGKPPLSRINRDNVIGNDS